MGTAFYVQIQLYVFISKPQLSINWDEGKISGGQSDREAGEREHTHTGLMPRAWLRVCDSDQHRYSWSICAGALCTLGKQGVCVCVCVCVCSLVLSTALSLTWFHC